MKFSVITLVLCAHLWAVAADVSHVKSVKTKLFNQLAGKHHKRGILSHVPPFKLGHDIPYVTHSVVKPLVFTYPPTASVAAVKIPVTGPHSPRYPVPVGHKVPGLPHPHYGLKFPHNKVVANSDHHFHHHHHHVAPRPVVPIIPATIPATPVTHAAPAPPQTIAVEHAPAPAPSIVPVPIVPRQPLPVPAPPVPVISDHLQLKPFLHASSIPIQPTPIIPSPIIPLSQSFPYIIRPGGAVQNSVFATYPRYPFLNSYQPQLLPLAPPAPAVPAIQQVLLERPHLHPYHILPQAAGSHGIMEQHSPNIILEQIPTHYHSTPIAPQPSVHLHPTQEAQPQLGFHFHPTQEAQPQPGFHLHPTQEAQPQPGFHLHPTQIVPQASFPSQPTQPSVPLEHDGWSPVPVQPHDINTSHEAQPHQTHHFTQEQGTQVFEQHTENQFHDYQHQLQHHIQQQIEQAQYEHSLHNQQAQPAQEYGVPQQLGQQYGQPDEYSQQDHDIAQHNQNFPEHGQDFVHEQNYAQNGQNFAQHGQDFSQHGQDFLQNGQDFNQNNYSGAHLDQEYGLPHQSVEGRSTEDNEQQYHNHIPLGLQPPLDRPLEHFQ